MDPTSGLQGLSWRAVLDYSKYGNFDDRYPDANMLTSMILKGYNVVEIPAVMHTRSYGMSMHSGLIKPIGYMFHMMLSIVGVVLRQKNIKRHKRLIVKKSKREDEIKEKKNISKFIQVIITFVIK